MNENRHDYFHAPGRVGCFADAQLMELLNLARGEGESIDEVVRRLIVAGLDAQPNGFMTVDRSPTTPRSPHNGPQGETW